MNHDEFHKYINNNLSKLIINIDITTLPSYGEDGLKFYYNNGRLISPYIANGKFQDYEENWVIIQYDDFLMDSIFNKKECHYWLPGQGLEELQQWFFGLKFKETIDE